MCDERELARVYLERTRAEFDVLYQRGFLLVGAAMPAVLLVKGAPGPSELAGGTLLSGSDGTALCSALDRLGYSEDDVAAVSAFCLADDSEPGDSPVPAVQFRCVDARDLALAVETFDPEAVVALDTPAARLLQEAWDLPEPLPVGAVARHLGRRVLALGGFEAALSVEGGKAAMWARLKQLPPLPAPL